MDRLALDRAVKETGLRRGILFAQELARIRWHESFWSIISVTEK